jgi:DNA uptake protein ComE-like DNA-binding protein
MIRPPNRSVPVCGNHSSEPWRPRPRRPGSGTSRLAGETVTRGCWENVHPRSARHGSILLLVLVAIIIMSLATGSYLVLMHNEYVATRYSGHHQQIRLLTESGIEYLRLFLSQTDSLVSQQGGLADNPGKMQSILVADDALADFRGRFTVLAPGVVQGYYSTTRYGMENESAKLNLNTLVAESDGGDDQEDESRERLLALPDMTEQIADAILDWLDEDDVSREYGAEESYYLALPSAYEPRNGRMTSLDELLLVRGVTPELLYGLDDNRNFVVDENEVARGAMEIVDNLNGRMKRGWSAYLTLHSLERLQSPAGERKINLNSGNLRRLYNDLVKVLDEPSAKFILAYRQYGAAGEETEGQTVDAASLDIDFEKQAENEIESPLDLVGARLAVRENEQAPVQIVESPWRDEPATYRQSYLDLLDQVSTSRGRRIAGQVNINLAARPVLMSVPGMTGLFADQIISRRNAEVDRVAGNQRHAVWILADGIVSQEEMKQFEPYMTTRGDVFCCQVVGFFEGALPQARVEVILDRSGRNTRLSAWQDLGPLGPGFARSVLGVDLAAPQ